MSFKNKEPDRKLIYKTIDGIDLPMWIFYPKAGLKDKNKAIVTIHGGGWTVGIKDNSQWDGCWLANQAKYYSEKDYVGIAISYRSVENENVDVYDIIQDCKDAILFIKNRLEYIDSESLIVFGESAGGHLATMLGISQDDDIRPYAVIAINPVLDCTREEWNYGFKGKDYIEATPMLKTPQKCAKFLFYHGTSDEIVNIDDTIKFHNKLNELGHISKFTTIPDAQHAFILFNYKYDDEYILNIMKKIDSDIQNVF